MPSCASKFSILLPMAALIYPVARELKVIDYREGKK